VVPTGGAEGKGAGEEENDSEGGVKGREAMHADE
jgi:hypothetical protein